MSLSADVEQGLLVSSSFASHKHETVCINRWESLGQPSIAAHGNYYYYYRVGYLWISEHQRGRGSVLMYGHWWRRKKRDTDAVCSCRRALKVGFGCVCAAPGPYPANQACCRTAASTGSAAAAPGSSQTHNPTVHSLFISEKAQKYHQSIDQIFISTYE